MHLSCSLLRAVRQTPQEDPLSNTNSKVLIAMLSVLTAIAVGLLLNLTSEIVVPLVIAWFLTQISRPVVAFGEKLRLPHIINVALVFILIFVLFSVGVNFAWAQVKESERIFNQYGGRLTQLMTQIIDALQIPTETISLVGLLKRYVGNISGGVINFSSQFVMTLCFLAFMLLETPTVNRKIDRQMGTGNVLGPKMLGDSLGLSPVVIMLSLLLWGMILGIPGAIISTPIAAIIKIVCENVPSLRPIAIMMGTGAEKKKERRKT